MIIGIDMLKIHREVSRVTLSNSLLSPLVYVEEKMEGIMAVSGKDRPLSPQPPFPIRDGERGS